MSLLFINNATFDIGTDLDLPVSRDHYDQAPFASNHTTGATRISYRKKLKSHHEYEMRSV